MIVTMNDARKFTIAIMQAKLSCMISGSPGIGKSSIVHAIAKQFNLELIDERLSTYDPVNLSGFPKFTKVLGDDGEVLRECASFIPFDTFPLEGIDKLPPGKNGWLIFLDEFNSAPQAVQMAAYRLVLDRQVGNYNLHPNTVIVCAGNNITDGALVNRLGTAMQSRLVHLEAVVDAEEWLDWGSRNGIDYRVLAYIAHAPNKLMVFDPKHNDKTFSCPRTWEFLSKLIKGVLTEDLKGMLALLAGTVGEGAAREFCTHAEIYTSMPTFKDICQDPLNTPIGKEPAVMFGVSHMIAHFVKKHDLKPVMKYLDRMPVEFQVVTLQNAVNRDHSLVNEPELTKWMVTKGAELL